MSNNLMGLNVTVSKGGFIVDVYLSDAAPDQYVVTSYAKLLKAIKDEFRDFKPVRKPRAKKEIA